MARILQFQLRRRPIRNPIAQGEGLFEVADAFAFLESAVTPSTKNDADEQYDEFELHMPIRSFAPRRMDESAFGYPKSRQRTFVEFVADFVADEKQCTTQLLSWRRRAHDFFDISVAPPMLKFAAAQTLTGNGH